MQQKLNVQYRAAAEELARRLTSALGDRIDSIVLYGSVVRGQARRDSDIDVLVIAPDIRPVRSSISEISSELMYERGYAFLISTIYLGRDEINELVQMRSPFIDEVLSEGRILYDNGTFTGVRKGVPAGL